MAYEQFEAADLILRDHLALDRTHLANERTLLAYIRTAFMLMAAGATAIKALADDQLAVLAGWALVAGGVVAFAFGAWRFATIRRKVRRHSQGVENSGLPPSRN